ncbi:unnamed protein product [Pylaiella littoralis]
MSGKGPAQTGETCLAMNSAIQVFGTAGLIETVVQFAYVLTNMENFTAFEQLFFLTSGCFEMAGEAIFLLASLWFFMRDSKAWKRGGGLSFLARDPIHCMAASSFEAASGEVNEAREDYARWSFFGVLLSVLPFTAWARSDLHDRPLAVLGLDEGLLQAERGHGHVRDGKSVPSLHSCDRPGAAEPERSRRVPRHFAGHRNSVRGYSTRNHTRKRSRWAWCVEESGRSANLILIFSFRVLY